MSEVEIDFTFLPGADQKGERQPARSLGRLAREFIDEGVPPPPRPTMGRVAGVELPLLYPGLNGIAGPAGTGKSLLTKHLLRQAVRAGDFVLVMDCESSEAEYVATLMADFGMAVQELDRVQYLTDDQRHSSRYDRWSGRDKGLVDALTDVIVRPSLVVVDSQSRSMAASGLDEVRPIDTARWYEAVTTPILDRWPDAAVATIQGRQKGWAPGMDVRQGRGSSALLHEVTAQYMLWPKKSGSRTVDGIAEMRCTKCRYGWRTEGSLAANWHYGPSGFDLVRPTEAEQEALPPEDQVMAAILDHLDEDPRDPHLPDVPPTTDHAVRSVMERLAVKSGQARALVERSLHTLIASGEVRQEQVAQPGKRGTRPQRVWTGEARGWTWC